MILYAFWWYPLNKHFLKTKTHKSYQHHQATFFRVKDRGTALQHVRTTTVVLVPSVGQWSWSCTTPFHCANTRPGRVGCFWGGRGFWNAAFFGTVAGSCGAIFFGGFFASAPTNLGGKMDEYQLPMHKPLLRLRQLPLMNQGCSMPIIWVLKCRSQNGK